MMKFSLKTLLVVFVTCSLLFLFFSYFKYYKFYYPSTATNVDSHFANRVIWRDYQLPELAKDVSFAVDFGACEVEFELDEEAFLDWCRQKNWEISIIETPVIYMNGLLLLKDTILVDYGFEFDPPNGRGVYDASRQRASLVVSTFP